MLHESPDVSAAHFQKYPANGGLTGCQEIFHEKGLRFHSAAAGIFSACSTISGGVRLLLSGNWTAWPRSTRDLLDTINEAGGKVQSMSEPWANTITHTGKMIMTVFVGIADFDRDLSRTGAGRDSKTAWRRLGRPRKRNADQAQVGALLLAEGKPARDIQRTRNHDLSLGRCFVTMVSDKPYIARNHCSRAELFCEI
jgi:hypothetical protein